MAESGIKTTSVMFSIFISCLCSGVPHTQAGSFLLVAIQCQS